VPVNGWNFLERSLFAHLELADTVHYPRRIGRAAEHRSLSETVSFAAELKSGAILVPNCAAWFIRRSPSSPLAPPPLRAHRFKAWDMGLQQGIEIRYSSDGPYLTFHGGGSRVTYSLRDVARLMSQSAEPGLQRRVLRAWLKDRDAERKPG
jgi:hypothetical protein